MGSSGQMEIGQSGSSTTNLVTATRQASKIRLILAVLLIIFVVLTIVFVVLYVNEKDDDSDAANIGEKGGQGGKNKTTSTASPTQAPTQSCEDTSCVISAGDILQKLDFSVSPCDDFYQYSCGGFVRKNYIADDKATLNSFNFVGEAVQNNLRRLLEDEGLKKNHSKFPNSAVSKAFDYYSSCVNLTHIEKAGLTPINDLIKKYGSSPLLDNNWNASDWNLERTLGRLMGELGLGVFVSLDITQSLWDRSRRMIGVGGGISGLGFEEKLSSATQQARLIAGYKKYMTTVFTLLGIKNETVLKSVVDELFLLEASFVLSKGNLQETAAVEGYYKAVQEMTLGELNNLTEYKFNWTTYINEALSVAGKSVGEDEKLMVALPKNVKTVIAIMTTHTPKSKMANEIIWCVVKNMIFSMPKEFREAENELNAISSGIETPPPRWKGCGELTNTNFEYATTSLYADRFLSEMARNRAADMFYEIRKQFIKGLEEQDWMDNSTRNQARIKLLAMKESVGYPLFIKNKTYLNSMYETFPVNPYDLFQNKLDIDKAKVVLGIKGLDQAPDDRRFPQPPVGVNAFYDPQSNKITVLTGMLKEPFYGSERLKALNYGAVGVIIGHEITHGFDTSGSQFDEKGNLRSWWTPESHQNYQQRSNCMLKQYNNTYVYGRKLDGLKTLPENIADNGGLKYSYRAYQKWREANGEEDKLPGLDFNNDQLFFIGFAQAWCAKYREEAISHLLQSDTHSLNPARVRVPISNFPEFSKTFGCKKPTEICSVW
ncbi:endothelin-converting enzyme homolog [Dendronephthya gigantea]|uniref:endothelin-converting enzyme homolog n=1 Tax=Dendronephthya gigantea TaxID=151771 RepID=UPI00106A7AE8|nr:endothelin-converting enzyme homolog [Dendronephthya gigantea]